MTQPLAPEIFSQLADIVGRANITSAREELLSYSYDGSNLEFLPAGVVFPGSAAEISRIMQLANSACVPVIPRGAGTGMTGGALAVQGGLILVMSRLNKILEVDLENQTAVVEPGVITGEFQQHVSNLGLFYPPDPASLKFCSMGGNVAECAGGPRAVKYGVTRDYIIGLEVVLPDGRIIQTGVKTAKGVVGYDLTRLFTGSEGTLGIITKITVRLLPYPPAKTTILICSSDIFEATALVAEILSQFTPCTLEYMDRSAVAVVDDFLPEKLPAGTNALLLIEFDGEEEVVALQNKRLLAFLADKNLVAVKNAASIHEGEALWAARKAVSPASFKLKPHKMGEDVVVPRSKIPALVSFTESLSRETDLPILTFGHAGDGNIHVNIMFDKKDPNELEQALTAKKKLFEHVLGLGGTISGEHGVGITKAPFLHLELDDAVISVMQAIKRTFDPNNILNPGKIFPDISDR